MDTSSMMIKGVRNLNVPDLRITTPVATISSFGRSASVAVIRVVKPNSCIVISTDCLCTYVPCTLVFEFYLF